MESSSSTTLSDSVPYMPDQTLSCKLPEVSGIAWCCLGCSCGLFRIPPQPSSVTSIKPSVLAGRAAAESTAADSNDAAASSTTPDSGSIPPSAPTTDSSAPTDIASQPSDSTSTDSMVSSLNLDDKSSPVQSQADKTWSSGINTALISSPGLFFHTSPLSTTQAPSAALPSSSSSTTEPVHTTFRDQISPVSSLSSHISVSSSADTNLDSTISLSSSAAASTLSLPSPTSNLSSSSGMSTGVKAAIGSGVGLAFILIIGFLAYMLFAGRKGKTETERTLELQDPPPQEEKPELKAEPQMPGVAMMDVGRQKEIGGDARHGFFELP